LLRPSRSRYVAFELDQPRASEIGTRQSIVRRGFSLPRGSAAIGPGVVAIECGFGALAGFRLAIARSLAAVRSSFATDERRVAQGVCRDPCAHPRLGLLCGPVAILCDPVAVLCGPVAVLCGPVSLLACLISPQGGLVSLVAGSISLVAGPVSLSRTRRSALASSDLVRTIPTCQRWTVLRAVEVPVPRHLISCF